MEKIKILTDEQKEINDKILGDILRTNTEKLFELFLQERNTEVGDND